MKWSYWEDHFNGEIIWNNLLGNGIIQISFGKLICRGFRLLGCDQPCITIGEDYGKV